MAGGELVYPRILGRWGEGSSCHSRVGRKVAVAVAAVPSDIHIGLGSKVDAVLRVLAPRLSLLLLLGLPRLGLGRWSNGFVATVGVGGDKTRVVLLARTVLHCNKVMVYVTQRSMWPSCRPAGLLHSGFPHAVEHRSAPRQISH